MMLEMDQSVAQSTNRHERLVRYGQELKRRRKAAGYRFAKDFALAANASPQYISQIETAYSTDTRAATEPEDEFLEEFARVLGWPKSEQLAMIRGIVTDDPQDRKIQAALKIAERYWDLTGRDKSLADTILGIDPNISAPQPRPPLRREPIWQDADVYPPAFTDRTPDIERTKEKYQQAIDADDPIPETERAAINGMLKSYLHQNGRRELLKVAVNRTSTQGYQFYVLTQTREVSGGLGSPTFLVNIQTGAVSEEE